MDYLKVALPKGRIGERTLEIFNSIGVKSNFESQDSRKLVLVDEENKIKFFWAKPSDIPIYIESGVADIGVVGKDTLMEEGKSLCEALDLKFGKCKMVVAGFKEQYNIDTVLENIRIATKYPRVAKAFFEDKRSKFIQIIKLNGSVELAPLVGLAELIVDIVESGRTLKENGLEVLEEISDISARLVVNNESLYAKSDKLNDLIQKIKEKIGGDENAEILEQ